MDDLGNFRPSDDSLYCKSQFSSHPFLSFGLQSSHFCVTCAEASHLGKVNLLEQRWDPLEWHLGMGTGLTLTIMSFIGGCASSGPQVIHLDLRSSIQFACGRRETSAIWKLRSFMLNADHFVKRQYLQSFWQSKIGCHWLAPL